MYIFMATFIGLIMNSKCQQTLFNFLYILIIFKYSLHKRCVFTVEYIRYLFEHEIT